MSDHYQIQRRKFLRISAIATTGLCVSASSLGIHRSSKPVRFGLVTDSHYADREIYGTRFYRQSLDKMEEFIQVMNNEKVDFIIHLGDFKDQDPQKREVDTLRYLILLEDIYSRFNGPRFHCIGNHDVDSITKQQFLGHITNTGIQNNQRYYSYNRNGYHFIVLDANFHQDGRDHFYKEEVDWQKTNIPEEQVDWLINDLEQTNYPTIIFCHHPLYAFNSDHIMHVSNYLQMQKALEKPGKVVAVFQGHVHHEEYREINGIHYVTQFGMVDYSGLENNSFAIIEMEGAKINVIGYKRVSSNRLKG